MLNRATEVTFQHQRTKQSASAVEQQIVAVPRVAVHVWFSLRCRLDWRSHQGGPDLDRQLVQVVLNSSKIFTLNLMVDCERHVALLILVVLQLDLQVLLEFFVSTVAHAYNGHVGTKY